eukprot:scaffold4480_cov51-Isochrysis_galbana.AAC.1
MGGGGKREAIEGGWAGVKKGCGVGRCGRCKLGVGLGSRWGPAAARYRGGALPPPDTEVGPCRRPIPRWGPAAARYR